ncbi:pro-resilin-like isoform X2 [Myzus persicae]|uniref:pro-resilin-like isoform X2 n=1 Tax=Myzus persicae TaxID=13164 RepID=UPI000B92FEDB|nr:pro-resilin-like isoform X2 [Myzus persicae]
MAVVVLLLNVFLTSLVCAQYGSPAGNSNPGYGGSGISVPSGDYGYKGQKPVSGAGVSDGNSEPEPFNFAYEVKDAPTNTDYNHEANSDGQRVTGKYGVLLPDGRYQVVTYVADENGYNAKVSYEGEAKPQLSRPGNPGSQGGYPSAPGFNSGAPSYPSASPAYGSAAPSYGSAAPAYNAPAPGLGGGYSGYPSSGSSPLAPSYLVQVPSFQNGIKGSSQQKQGNQYK